MNIEEIKDLKQYYTENLYKAVRREQQTDQTYRDDTFAVPEIKAPHVLLRSGIGARMVDSPAEQIITSDPQAVINLTKGEADISKRLSKEINQSWIKIMRRQNPNPFKEFVKNLLGRGEGFIQIAHNERWVSGRKERVGLPVLFLIPDSMVIYSSPAEDYNGVPEKVIVFYARQPRDVILKYHEWSNPKRRKEGDEIEWMEYWDKDSRYFEADGEAVLKDGLQANPYGLVPFVRKYSGFGRRSPTGKMEDLIVSDIRFSRDLIKEECAIRSDIASIMHLYAHKRMDLIIPDTTAVNEADIREDYDMGAGSFNVLSLPAGSKLQEGVTMLPSAEAFQHLYNIRAEIDKRNPFIMSGFPFGSSGRQQDMTSLAAMRRYDTIVENTELAFATAFEIAVKICGKIPTLRPDGLLKQDVDAVWECDVELKASDPIERDRLITLGDRLWNGGNGSIDLRTFLTEFQGRTEDEAEDIIANILVDKLTLYNPDVASVMGMVFAEESGMSMWLEEAQQRRQTMESQQSGLQKAPPPTTTERTQGEANTPMGRELIDMSLANRGARQSPMRFTRS